jgi:acetyl-CoA carboxylase carboxyl transferase subunit beta
MNWFIRTKEKIFSGVRKQIPDGIWHKCPQCGEVIYFKELDKNARVCTKCSYHFRIYSEDYLELLADNGQYSEFNVEIGSEDPLKFKIPKRYTDSIQSAKRKTGLNEAVRTAELTIQSIPLIAAVMDFRFVGGSMGSAVGEKIARAVDKAIKRQVPFLIVSASGGARMQEGVLSLMQMAKTSARLSLLAEKGLPFISVLTDPTTGGVSASFAMLGDINIAEPGALIGFAGQRVIKQTIGKELPNGFQRSEFLLEKGLIDQICDRRQLKSTIYKFLQFYYA